MYRGVVYGVSVAIKALNLVQKKSLGVNDEAERKQEESERKQFVAEMTLLQVVIKSKNTHTVRHAEREKEKEKREKRKERRERRDERDREKDLYVHTHTHTERERERERERDSYVFCKYTFPISGILLFLAYQPSQYLSLAGRLYQWAAEVPRVAVLRRRSSIRAKREAVM